MPTMTPNDLITPRQQLLAYRKAIALEKKVIARPYLFEAKVLKCIASDVRSFKDVRELEDFRASLLAASGLSVKIFNVLSNTDQSRAIWKSINTTAIETGKNFADELESGYFRSKRNVLRRKARNLANSLAHRKFLRCLISGVCVKSCGNVIEHPCLPVF